MIHANRLYLSHLRSRHHHFSRTLPLELLSLLAVSKLDLTFATDRFVCMLLRSVTDALDVGVLAKIINSSL